MLDIRARGRFWRRSGLEYTGAVSQNDQLAPPRGHPTASNPGISRPDCLEIDMGYPLVALSSKAAPGTPTINVDDDDEPDVDRMEPNAPETFRTNRLREIPCNAYRWVCRLVAARRQCSKRDCLGSSSGSAACHTKFNRLGRGTSTVLTSGLPS